MPPSTTTIAWSSVSAATVMFSLLVLFNWREAHLILDLPKVGPNKAPFNLEHLRMNEIQVIGTHNSYHREVSPAERAAFGDLVGTPEDYFYSHAEWANQLTHQGVRSIEIDVHSDEHGGLYANPLIWQLSNLTNETVPWHDDAMTEPGLKVFHATDADTNAICHTFTECLIQLKNWSDANPRHLPITVDLELKSDADYCKQGGLCEIELWTLHRILGVDREINAVLPRNKLLIPDDVRRSGMTLEHTILSSGWPTLESARGKFMFYFDNEPDNSDPSNYRNLYRANGHESLENRTVFTNAIEGEADAAFIKHNEPDVEQIMNLVKKGYFVRTRADVPLETIRTRNITTKAQALMSGAQIVTTDFPVYGMSSRWDWDYAVQFENGVVARCNPVLLPKGCANDDFERMFL